MSVWFLVGAILVFFMQCGFAMVETGFTRAKNAGNIIMKNLMDFCIGTVVFVLLGYGIMNSENYFFGLIGMPEYQMFTSFYDFDWSNFFFQLVFCATAATIVSGAMAERTKFLAYCVYSGFISAIVYPIEAGWVWNSRGWLVQLGYVDFAGSSVIHMVGGLSALLGAWMLGPRLGKYSKEKNGKVQVNAIPGHSLTLGALGCFILWFCWYGFNGAAASDVTQMAQILGTTTIAPAVATVSCMVFTWIRSGKPDVSMCLNASLAGLVGITAPCASVDVVGAAAIGAVSGVLVVAAVEFIDQKLHVDDPVGAVAVHCANGIWGTIAEGLFSTSAGLFYGGGVTHLAVQCLGVVSIGGYTLVVMFLVYKFIDATVGLRVTAEEEIMGLDVTEHGLTSAYADFLPVAPGYGSGNEHSGPGPVGGAGGIHNLPPAGERIWRDHVGVGRAHSHMAFPVFNGRDHLPAIGFCPQTEWRGQSLGTCWKGREPSFGLVKPAKMRYDRRDFPGETGGAKGVFFLCGLTKRSCTKFIPWACAARPSTTTMSPCPASAACCPGRSISGSWGRTPSS